jgi:hypothetical protein
VLLLQQHLVCTLQLSGELFEMLIRGSLSQWFLFRATMAKSRVEQKLTAIGLPQL